MYLRAGRLLTNAGPLRAPPKDVIAAAEAAPLRHPNPDLPPDADLTAPREYSSCDGCRQGDPHGPWLFAVAIHDTLHEVQRKYPDVRIFCYLDDCYLLGPPKRVYAANVLLQKLMSEECTLESNLKKVEFYCPSALSSPSAIDFVDARIKGSPHHPEGPVEGFKCLGSYIGQDEWCKQKLRARIAEHLRPLATLVQLADTPSIKVVLQSKLLILRWCVNSIPNYWIRTMPPHVSRPAVKEAHREAVDRTLQELLDFDASTPRGQLAMRQAYLPLDFGGLGLTALDEVADAAWASSMANSWQHFQNTLGDACPSLPPNSFLEDDDFDRRSPDTAPSSYRDLFTQIMGGAHASLREHRGYHVDRTSTALGHDAKGAPIRRYHPVDQRGLPRNLPRFSQLTDAKDARHRAGLQSKITTLYHADQWSSLHADILGRSDDWDIHRAAATSHPRREACRLISASAPSAGVLWDIIPTHRPFSIPSAHMLFATQRRLGLPLTCLRGVTHLTTRACGPVDPLGDVAVNSFAEHNTRHNQLAGCYARFGKRCLGGTASEHLRQAAYARTDPPSGGSEKAPKLPDVVFYGAAKDQLDVIL